MPINRSAHTLVYAILFLLFLQVISDFIESIYAFGLLAVSLTPEVAAVVLLFTPLALILVRRPPSRGAVLAIACVAILGRLVEPMLDPRGKLLASGVSVGAFMLLFPLMLYRREKVRGANAAAGLALAVALSIFFRTVNSSVDVSAFGMFQIIGWALGAAAVVLLWRMPLEAERQPGEPVRGSTLRVIRLAVGMAGVMLMIYFTFASPTVISRWTEASYIAIIALLSIALTAYCFLHSPAPSQGWPTRRLLLVWNGLFLLTLVLTILPHQIAFPAARGAYPLDAPLVSPFWQIPLYLMLLLSPVLFLDFMLYARQMSVGRPTLRQLGGAFAWAGFVFLALVFFHVFTTTYDYVPVIGPVFRDFFWFVYLLAGLAMSLPLFVVSPETFTTRAADKPPALPRLLTAGLALAATASACLTAAKPARPPGAAQLKVMTYNIQQGFDSMGNKNLEAQLAAIRRVDPDLLGLQESDTARIANGNVDAVRYFADRLGMYSYYGPTTTVGTFGVALLSKFPIEDPRTFFMYSEGEQTATIQATITGGGTRYQVFVTHLGNGGPPLQLEDVLTRLEGLDNVILMGDFNFSPASDQYVVISLRLEDAFLSRWPEGKEIPGLEVGDRIDHIFVSPGTHILEAEYVLDPASDHPYQYAVVTQ